MRRERPRPFARAEPSAAREAPAAVAFVPDITRIASRRSTASSRPTGAANPGGIPERPKGSDCKSDGHAFAGSNPAPPTTSQLPSAYRLVPTFCEAFPFREALPAPGESLPGSGFGNPPRRAPFAGVVQW